MHILFSIGRSTCSVRASSWVSLAAAFWAGRKLSSSTTYHKEPSVAKVVYKTTYRVKKRYGFWNFIVDCALTMVTGGLWLIWVFVREMRNR